MKSLLKILLVAKLTGIIGLKIIAHVYKSADYSYIGDDYPPTWQLGGRTRSEVIMPFENSVRFSFENSEESQRNWRSQFPGDGMIYLGKSGRPFSISMFHQVRCISIIRSTIIERQRSNYTSQITALTTHCFNYLRQMALCRSDIDLEPVLFYPSLDAFPDTYVCTDWRPIYEALEENHRNYFKK